MQETSQRRSAGGRGRGICKFFLEGKCLKGANCNYSHVLPDGSAQPQWNDAGAGTASRGGRSLGASTSGFGRGFRTNDSYSDGNASGPSHGGSVLGRRLGDRIGGENRSGQSWGRQKTERGGGSGGGMGRGRGRIPGSEGILSRRACKYFLEGSCNRGERCTFLHAHTTATDVEMMTELKGHSQTVRTICLPLNSPQLYTGGQDGTVRVWDCTSGQCTNVITMGADVGALLVDSGWLFVGLPKVVKTWITATGVQSDLEGPPGAVHALCLAHGLLFAACQDGSILCWRFNEGTQRFEPAASLAGHTKAVVCMQCSPSQEHLVSGSMDTSIRVWDVRTLACLYVLDASSSGGGGVVMGVAFWHSFLLSCSLDGSVKVWSPNAATGLLECSYTHPEVVADAGLIPSTATAMGIGARTGTGTGSHNIGSHDGALCLQVGHDAAGKDIALVAYNDNTVQIYDLPSFSERGTLFTRQEVRCITCAPGGLVFTGDSSGDVKVWRFTA